MKETVVEITKEVAILAVGVLLAILALRAGSSEGKTSNEELKGLTLDYQTALLESVKMLEESEEKYINLLRDYLECVGVPEDSIELKIKGIMK